MEAIIHDQPTSLLKEAWQAFGGEQSIVDIEELSANVSNNRVFRLRFEDQSTIIAKCSSYGSYKQFVEDHERIRLWSKLMEKSRFSGFLANTLIKGQHVFSYFKDEAWVIFYEEKPKSASLPKILRLSQVELFAKEIASFHSDCIRYCKEMPPLAKSAITDILDLHQQLLSRQQPYPLQEDDRSYLLRQCDTFLERMQTLGYEKRTRIPLLVDWNIGNFSIEGKDENFQLQSRWDYDWFRMEPAIFDFYFCSRIVSHEGDRGDFSYWPHGFFEPRFKHFLLNYHKINPLQSSDIFFVKEVYRFFILNYVIKDGIYFFRKEYFERLKKEAIEFYLPEVDAFDFMQLYNEVKHIIR